MSDFVKELNFDGDTFNDMKRDMNFAVTRTMGCLTLTGTALSEQLVQF